MDAAERLAIQLHGDADVVDGGGAVEKLELAAKRGVAQDAEVGPAGDVLAVQGGIGVDDGGALGVHDGSVVNDLGIADDGVQHVVQIGVALKVVGDGRAENV